MTAVFDIDADLVAAWAELSGDHNRLHVDPDFATTTPYGRCIAHGPLLASLVGELLAARLGDGPSTTSFRFVAPVFVPSRVTATVEIGPSGTARVECVDDAGTTVLTAESGRPGGPA